MVQTQENQRTGRGGRAIKRYGVGKKRYDVKKRPEEEEVKQAGWMGQSGNFGGNQNSDFFT